MPQVRNALDPLQFAYKEKVGTEDAMIYVLHRSLSHLDSGSGALRIMFLDLPSTFNAIQPQETNQGLCQMVQVKPPAP